VGCSGTGSSCGSSCGGAFKTVGVGTDGPNVPYRYAGSTLDNVAQVRITKSAFDSLFSAGSLNDVLAGLGNTLAVPCFDPKHHDPADTAHPNSCGVGTLPSFCACTSCGNCSTNLPGGFVDISKFGLIIGDANFNGVCDAGETTPVDLKFKQVAWTLDAGSQMLKAKIILHIKAALYLRTIEAHSSFCTNTTPIQGRVFIDDEATGLVPQDTELDLDLKFGTAPDGRLMIYPTDASIAALVDNFNIAALGVDGSVSANQLPPGTGTYQDNGCNSTSVTGYNPYKTGDNTRLACSEVFNILAGGCNGVDPNTTQGIWCTTIWPTVRQLLFDQLKGLIKNQVTAAIKTQLDNLRCERPLDAQGKAVACDNNTRLCPKDDAGHAETCDTARGVCVATGQDKTKGECEPTPFAIQGQLDLAAASSTPVGFPSDARLNLYAGLGGTTAPAAISPTGLQIAARAGTQPAANTATGISVCVPPNTFVPVDVNPPGLDFDLAANQPDSVKVDGLYDLGFSVASQMLNRGFYDGFNSGLFCLTVSNKTASLVSSSLFKTFLPSLGLLAGGKDVPMAILLRPTLAPFVRIGKGTFKPAPDNSIDDPLIGIQLNKLNLDFYAVIDERSVRLFTLQADVNLPLGLRTFAGAQADTLQPVLGSLDTVLTNITAINNEMLAEDPTVLKDLIGAAIRLAQPLLAGALQPIALPKAAGLDFQVKGLGGAVPVSSNIAVDGYHHLGIWAQIARCGAAPLPACARYQVGTEARIADRQVPDDLDELRGPNKVIPAAVIEARSISARAVEPEFSYRVDGGLWSPWVRGPRFTVRDSIFLFQGHHQIDVTSRELGDDRTMNQEPVSVDFLVSIEPPTADLVQLADGSVVTKAHSVASQPWQLSYSYRLEGERAFGEKGPARSFTAQELGGRGVSVLVTDEAGRTAKASFGITDASDGAAALSASGCATGPQTTAWSLFPLLAVGLVLAFRRRSSR
jgi:MYXO-CTERM domain-containing protein